ncbi:hypothetical protein AHAS_Ahas15G0087200 [Arachis hypogaea]
MVPRNDKPIQRSNNSTRGWRDTASTLPRKSGKKTTTAVNWHLDGRRIELSVGEKDTSD